MIDLLKGRGITAVMTSLRAEAASGDADDLGVSSLMDAWVKLLNVEANGERTRTLYVIKARGMSHSNQVREFVMSGAGIRLVDAYVGPAGVLTGTAREAQEAQERAAALNRRQETERRKRVIAQQRRSIERQIAELHASLEVAEEEEALLAREDASREALFEDERSTMAQRRTAAE
jgi:circadian clock protein KaiC